MGVRDEELAKQEGWPLGINNVASETAVSAGALRMAQNVDLDDAGKPRRMAGWVRELAGEHRSVWGCESLPFGLVAKQNTLCTLDEDATVTDLRSGIALNDLACCDVLGDAYWTDGREIGRVMSDRTLRSVGCEQPQGLPQVAAHSSGGLAAGRYMVAITYQDDAGEESGADLAVDIELQDGQGIMLSSIPQPVSAVTSTINLFVSNAGGEDLFWRASVPAGIDEYLIGSQRAGRRLETQFCSPMPAGQCIAYSNGRLYVGAGDTVWYSQPQRYGITRRADNYARFGGRICGVAGVGEAANGSGLYVGAGGRTYWLAGPDPRAWQRVVAYPHDIVEGTMILVRGSMLGPDYPTTMVAHWLASNGVFCIGLPNGQVQAYTEGRYLADEAVRGAALLREQNGIRSILTVVNEGPVNRAKFTDKLIGTVYRNGVAI
jgi:hypothetical protein